jgi:hypothetical protein
VKILVAFLAAAIGCGSAVAAPAPPVNLLDTFKPLLPHIKRTTTVAVLLPSSLPTIDKTKVYASEAVTKSGWQLELADAPGCGEATACFLASFAWERGGSLPGSANARDSAGDPAFFKNISCGGSCSPASLWFVHKGVVYSWQDTEVTLKSARTVLIGLAEQALAAGPR